MQNNKLVVALFVGAIQAKQLPKINMIGAGMLDENLHDLHNATQEAEAWGQYAIIHSDEGKQLQGAYGNWTQTEEAQKLIRHVEYFPKSPEGKPIFEHLGQAGHIVETKGSLNVTVDPHSHYAYLGNKNLAKVRDHLEQAEHHVEALKGTNWEKGFPYTYK